MIMKEFIKKYWLLVVGIIVLIVSVISYFYLNQKWISFISFIVGILGVVISLWQAHQGANIKGEYEKIINDYKEKYKTELSNSNKLEKEKQIISFEKSELNKFLEKINETLQRESISKEELIKNIASSLKAVVFFKTSEIGFFSFGIESIKFRSL